MDMPSRAHIWATLTKIDVAEFCTETEVLGDQVLTYLPWMKAHEVMMSALAAYEKLINGVGHSYCKVPWQGCAGSEA